MNTTLTKFLLVSASALFLVSQSAEAMITANTGGDDEDAANFSSRVPTSTAPAMGKNDEIQLRDKKVNFSLFNGLN